MARLFSAIAKRRGLPVEAEWLASAAQSLARQENCSAGRVRKLAAASLLAGIYATKACGRGFLLGGSSSPACTLTIFSLRMPWRSWRAKRGGLRLKRRALLAKHETARGAQVAGASTLLDRRVKRLAMRSFSTSSPYHLSCFGPLEELGQRQCAGSASQQEAEAAFEPGKGTAIGFADTPMVGVGLFTGFFSVAVGWQRASSCPA